MLEIVYSSQLKKDLKKAKKQGKNLALLQEILLKLAKDKTLEPKYCDHELTGNWKGYRECHINPDWLLIYRVVGKELRLARVGSHSELFG